MNRFRKIVLPTLLVLISQLIAAQEAYKVMNDVATFKSKLGTVAASIKTITCDFVQEKNLAVLSEKIISKGHFWFMKENNIRWEYTEPYTYLIIITNNQLFTRDNKNKNQYDIQSNRMFQEMSRFISSCIKVDIVENRTDYSIEYYENSKRYFVKLIPLQEKMKQMLTEVQLWFDKEDMSIAGLKMIEPGDDYTKIDFINKKLNLDIPLEKFDFK
jgi:outer membrane lipoprotein-sorting protein